MAWREMLRYGGPEARRIHDAAFPHAPLEPGRNIRIAMEEEVSECCERWRQALCFAGGHGRWDKLIGPVIYCPTCREKL
jgi:hypothetical protein